MHLIILLNLIKFARSIEDFYETQPPFRTHLGDGAASGEKRSCEYEVDTFGCMNINCNGVKRLRELPRSIDDLVNTTSTTTLGEQAAAGSAPIVCSLDLAETGISRLDADTFANLDLMLFELIRRNSNQTNTNGKVSRSHLDEIRQFKLPVYLNFVLVIRDSNVKYVQPKALSMNNQLELNLIGLNMSSINWFHMLESAKLKLLSLRNIPNLKEEFNSQNKEFIMYPIAAISDVKIYNSYLPIIDDYFFLFKLLKSIEQLELNSCSISFIKSSIFDKYIHTFRHLRHLSLTNNNLNKISDQTFNGLINLVSLDLDDNPIEYIHPNAFTGLKKLRTLSLNSNTLKSQGVFNSNPLWIFSTIKTNKHLQEISFKTNKMLRNTCLLNTILATIQSINANIIETAKNESAVMNDNSTTTMLKKSLYLFTHDQIVYAFNNLNSLMNDIYCNVYLVCQMTRDQHKTATAAVAATASASVWIVEVFRSCPAMITDAAVVDNDQKCFLDKKINECEYSKSKLAKQLNVAGSSSTPPNAAETFCSTVVSVVVRFKWAFITGTTFVSIIFLLFFIYCVRSCMSGVSDDSDDSRRRRQHRHQRIHGHKHKHNHSYYSTKTSNYKHKRKHNDNHVDPPHMSDRFLLSTSSNGQSPSSSMSNAASRLDQLLLANKKNMSASSSSDKYYVVLLDKDI